MTRALVLQAQTGDHAAFTSLAAASIGRLFGSATLILRDGEAASDVVQETLVQAWRDLPSLRDPDRWEAWLHRLLVRACYRSIAARDRRRIVEIKVLDMDAAAPSRESDIVARDQVQRAFQRLTPDHRAILVLHHLRGFELAEAAAILGVPVGTAKSRLNRATAALRSALDAGDREPVALRGRIA